MTMNAGYTPAWEAKIRRWHIASAFIAVAQLICIVTAFVFVLSDPAAAFGLCAVLLLLEFAKWLVDQQGLRQIPGFDFEELYASAPLEQAHRALVAFNLAGVLILVLFLSRISPEAGLVGLLTAVTTLPPLVRVWRRNSWLAISRLPSRPRRRPRPS
jgi:hypothetical protein